MSPLIAIGAIGIRKGSSTAPPTFPPEAEVGKETKMSENEKRNENKMPEGLEDAVPMELGLVELGKMKIALIGMLLLSLAIPSLVWHLWILTHMPNQVSGMDVIILFVTAAGFVLGGLFGVGLVLLEIEKITPCWRRNVVGYDAWFWILDNQGVDPDVGVIIVSRGNMSLKNRSLESSSALAARGKHNNFLRVPLGGWFRRRQGQLFYCDSSDYLLLTMAWRVRAPKPITDPIAGQYVELIDGKGDAIALTVGETLRFAHQIHGGIQEWRHEVPNLLREVRERRREIAEIRAEREEVMEALLAAKRHERELLEETIGQLDATKRFIRSKQAKKIRDDLAMRLAVFEAAEIDANLG